MQHHALFDDYMPPLAYTSAEVVHSQGHLFHTLTQAKHAYVTTRILLARPQKEYTPSAALARRLPSKWPRPAWHPPWKTYRVIAGHLGWVRSVACDPANEWLCTGSPPHTHMPHNPTHTLSCPLFFHRAQVGAQRCLRPRQRVVLHRLRGPHHQDLGHCQRPAQADADGAHRAGWLPLCVYKAGRVGLGWDGLRGLRQRRAGERMGGAVTDGHTYKRRSSHVCRLPLLHLCRLSRP